MNKPSANELYVNGHFNIPTTRFYDGWVARITGVGGRYILDRKFIKKYMTGDNYLFDAPEDGFYHVKAKSDIEPLDELVHVKNGIPYFTSLSLVKLEMKRN